MHQLRPDDFFEIRIASVLTDYDVKVLTAFYQPLIGSIGLSLYLTLHSLHHFNQTDPYDHSVLFSRMDLSRSDFLIARSRLEAMGLIRSYYKKDNKIHFYYYELYGPKDAFHFLDDPIFKGTLVKFIGERAVQRLAYAFKTDDPFTEVEEVSAKFIDVFRPDFNDPAFKAEIENYASSHQIQELASAFTAEVFFAELKSQGYINKKALSQSEIERIEQLSTLYGLSEALMAKCTIMAFSPDQNVGSRVNFEQLRTYLQEEAKYSYIGGEKAKRRTPPSIISGTSLTARQVNEMEQMSPLAYLSKRQKGAQLASADIRLLEDLSQKFHLANGVINALISKVLELNHNQLSRVYVEKIAATLARTEVQTALDTLNYFEEASTSQKYGGKQKQSNSQTKGENAQQNKPAFVDSSGDDEEIAMAVAALEAQLEKKK